MEIDLTGLTLWQVFGFLTLVALIDIAGSIALALVKGTFNLGSIAVWIQSHVLRRVFPIFGLAVIGHGIPQLNIPAIDIAFGMALAALAAYALETIASLRDSFGGNTEPPTNTTPAT
jgi:hypothetical protein